MKIKALRSAQGAYGTVRRGQVIEVADQQAQQLVKRGLFVPADGKEAAGKASARPSGTSRTGGRTGKAKPSSSSPAGRASKTSRSTNSQDERE